MSARFTIMALWLCSVSAVWGERKEFHIAAADPQPTARLPKPEAGAISARSNTGKRAWGPEQACGAPDTTVMGDLPTAWASQLPNAGIEWLELTFDQETEIAELVIYESDNPGAVTKVVALKPDRSQADVWEGNAPATDWREQVPRPLKLTSQQKGIQAKAIRIYLDTRLVSGWNEIDAVELIGSDGMRQWAQQASASSTFAAMMAPFQAAWQTPWPPYDPRQATGPPNTLQMCDCPTAWASQEPDRGYEWLVLAYSNEVEIAAVNIYENLHPGAITNVTALPESGEPQVMWQGIEPTRPVVQGPAAIFTVEPDKAVRAKKIKLEFDTKRIHGWNEIDAVQLVGADGSRQWAMDAEASSAFGRGSFPAGRPFSNLALPAGVNNEALNQSVQRLTERIAELERRIQSMEATSPPPAVALRDRASGPAKAWHPEQACGPPDTLTLGDYTTAWASQASDGGPEWLELLYEQSVEISQIHIYESYNPGAITSVVAIVRSKEKMALPVITSMSKASFPRNDGFYEVPLWTGASPRVSPNARLTQVFVVRPELQQQPVHGSRIRIYQDTRLVPSWNEIDAVELVGADGSRQWASKAAASSSYGGETLFAKRLEELIRGANLPPKVHTPPAPRSAASQLTDLVQQYSTIVEEFQSALKTGAGGMGNRPQDAQTARRRDRVNSWSWGPEQACGPPDTGALGDFHTAWAPNTMDGGIEWLELGFDREIELGEVRIYESYGPGTITKVIAKTADNEVVLTSRDKTSNWLKQVKSGGIQVNTIQAPKPGLRTSRIRVELDTRLVPGWNEIDAIELIGADGSRQWATEASASSSYAD